MIETRLDTAFLAMEDSDAARLTFYERFADSELFLLLDETSVTPETPLQFETSDGPMILVFDSEERLGAFAGGPAPYAALPGRAIARMLAEQGVGIAFNPDVAPSSMVIPPKAIAWLCTTLDSGPRHHEARPTLLQAPLAPPELIEALDRKLAAATGLGDRAWLAGATYADGTRALFLAVIAPRPGAESALARAVSEALTFSGVEDRTLDVGFFAADDPITEILGRVGLGFALPLPEAPPAPMRDPDTPPRLR